MRLGQLARQLEIKPENIVNYLEKEKGIILNSHPNSKVDDEWIEDITNHFKPIEKETLKEEVVEKKAKVETLKEEEKKEVKVEEKEGPTDDTEHIETLKTELEGPKVVGKIDLPDKKEIQVEIDGVVYDQEFLDKKKKDELEANRKQKELEKEEKKKEEQEKKRIAQEKRKLEAERQAMLAQEKHNALSAEEEKKKQAILKAQQERERKLEEKRKQRQKEFYAQKHAIKNTTPKKKKQEDIEKVIEVEIAKELPKETNIFKRFMKWLNT